MAKVNKKVIKGQLLVEEGKSNQELYIVRKGEFQVRKRIKTEMPATNEQVKQFLQGVTAKRSVRQIFNNKIKNLTNQRGLTGSTEVMRDEDVFTLTEGQIFGEERFLEIHERKEFDKRKTTKPVGVSYDEQVKAPFTIKCMSNSGELMVIALSEFEGLFKKDAQIRRGFIANYKAKMRFLQTKMENMHMDLKFSSALIEPLDDEDDDGTMSCGSN